MKTIGAIVAALGLAIMLAASFITIANAVISVAAYLLGAFLIINGVIVMVNRAARDEAASTGERE